MTISEHAFIAHTADDFRRAAAALALAAQDEQIAAAELAIEAQQQGRSVQLFTSMLMLLRQALPDLSSSPLAEWAQHAATMFAAVEEA